MKARHLPLLLTGLDPFRAAETAGPWVGHAVERARGENYDPTLVTRRVLGADYRYALPVGVEIRRIPENLDSALIACPAWHF